MKVVLAALADGANVSDMGKMNVLGVFNSIFAVETPTVVPLCYLAVVLRPKEDEKGASWPFQVVLRDPDARPVFSLPQGAAFEVPQSPGGARIDVNLVIALGGLQFPRFGDYELEFAAGEARHAIELVVQPIIQQGRGHVA